MRQIKVGDKFNLIGKVFTVEKIVEPAFRAETRDEHYTRAITLKTSDADLLDWIVPEPKISKEAAEAILGYIDEEKDISRFRLKTQIISMIE